MEISFLGWDSNDTYEFAGMVLDQQFQDWILPMLPEQVTETLPDPTDDIAMGLLALAAKKLLKPQNGTWMAGIIDGVMKKNFAEAISTKWFQG